jgi:ribosomal protein S18 acetylase RimI-like enzyme
VRYTWDLQSLDLTLRLPDAFDFRPIAPTQVNEVIELVLSAFKSDPTWQPLLTDIKRRLHERIAITLGTKGSTYIGALQCDKLVGVTGVAAAHWSGQNLLTDICVLPAYQRKGLGKSLLGISLLVLRAAGRSQARVYTAANSLADQKLYPLFEAVREENVQYPSLG